MTAISVSVGGALGAIDGSFSWLLYLITLIGTIFLHGATNLINDYYDVKSEVDTQEALTAQYRPHPLVEGKLKTEHVRLAAFGLYALSALIGIYLAATRGWELLWIGLIGAFASLTYTAPPLKYKYSALGEISVFLMWGPLMVAGSYFVQRQAFSMDALWISLPFGVLVALADQVAIAIENARIFQENQAALARAEETYRRYVRQEWDSFLRPGHAAPMPVRGGQTIPDTARSPTPDTVGAREVRE